jgi:NADPH-dependent curcumin reductase CurA
MDRTAHLFGVSVLGVLGLTATVGLVVVASLGEPVPPSLVAIASACVGAIAGLLAQPRPPQ